MKRLQKLYTKLDELKSQLSVCVDPEEKGNLDEKIDFIQDDINEIESEVDPEDIYGILGHSDSSCLEPIPLP